MGLPGSLIDPVALALSALTPEGRWPASVHAFDQRAGFTTSDKLATFVFRVTRLISVRFRYSSARASRSFCTGVAAAAVRVASCFMDIYMAHLSVRTINQAWPGAPDFTDFTDAPNAFGVIRAIRAIRGRLPLVAACCAVAPRAFGAVFLLFFCGKNSTSHQAPPNAESNQIRDQIRPTKNQERIKNVKTPATYQEPARRQEKWPAPIFLPPSFCLSGPGRSRL